MSGASFKAPPPRRTRSASRTRGPMPLLLRRRSWLPADRHDQHLGVAAWRSACATARRRTAQAMIDLATASPTSRLTMDIETVLDRSCRGRGYVDVLGPGPAASTSRTSSPAASLRPGRSRRRHWARRRSFINAPRPESPAGRRWRRRDAPAREALRRGGPRTAIPRPCVKDAGDRLLTILNVLLPDTLSVPELAELGVGPHQQLPSLLYRVATEPLSNRARGVATWRTFTAPALRGGRRAQPIVRTSLRARGRLELFVGGGRLLERERRGDVPAQAARRYSVARWRPPRS